MLLGAASGRYLSVLAVFCASGDLSCVSPAGGDSLRGGRSAYASYDKRFSYAAAAATGRRISRRIRRDSPLSQISRVPLLRTAPEMGLMDAEGS